MSREDLSTTSTDLDPEDFGGIAIVGMAGRFPGAADLDAFWRNLRAGVEAIERLDAAALDAAGVDPVQRRDPAYVPSRGVLGDVELFDADLFGISPREAALMDPQQRLLLEHAWAALDNAALDPRRFEGLVGAYVGTGESSYLWNHLLAAPSAMAAASALEVKLGNARDFLASTLAYHLDLRGPALTLATACSTSLVAIHLAAQALLHHECDAAVAGGVSVALPQAGYVWDGVGILSRDGACRAFSAEATGSVTGSGVGVVVLRRLADALADGDPIRAVIRGSAVNNDGAARVGFTAPGVEGQAAVIAEALAVAEVDPETLGYVEAHGTGTPLGDPIEVRALTRAFRFTTEKRGFCALGSVKSNLGHLDAAAGVAGVIKTVLALEHGEIPPSLHGEPPNPEIDFASGPFFVNSRLRPWPRLDAPRRAGVSSFGMGGANAHLVLEEAPRVEDVSAVPADETCRALLLSARDEAALDAACERLAAHLEAHPGTSLADVAHTLAVGRVELTARRAVLARSTADAAVALRDPARRISGVAEAGKERPVAFLLPGLGAQRLGMAARLHADQPAFRDAVDRAVAVAEARLDLDLRPLLLEPAADAADATDAAAEAPAKGAGPAIDLRRMLRRESAPQAAGLSRASVAHPALFALEYALAQAALAWGIRPRVLLGYSLGEWVAACLAGVFSFDDALTLVGERARLCEEAAPGGMAALPLGAEAAAAWLRDQALDGALEIAALNGPHTSVVAGPLDALARAEEILAEQGTPWRRLPVERAFHTGALAVLGERLAERVAAVERRAPEIPLVSNVTGTWLSDAEAVDPRYWARQMSSPVRFADALETLWAEDEHALLELGPGQGLITVARQHPGAPRDLTAVAALPESFDRRDDRTTWLEAASRLWLVGAPLDTAAIDAHAPRRRVALPTYPFARRRHWIEPERGAAPSAPAVPAPSPSTSSSASAPRTVDDWFYLPSWRRTLPSPPPTAESLRAEQAEAGETWWIVDGGGEAAEPIAEAVVELLRAGGREVARSRVGDDPVALCAELRRAERAPTRILHLAALGRVADAPLAARREAGFHSLVEVARAALAQWPDRPLRCVVAARGLASTAGRLDPPDPALATLLGPCAVIPQEHPNLLCRAVDVDPATVGDGPGAAARTAARLVAEALRAPSTGSGATPLVALRGGDRLAREYVAAPLAADGPVARAPRPGGTYWIVGGLGRVGLQLAEDLAARAPGVRLILSGRSPRPPRRFPALEERGAQVHLEVADAADAAAMRRVLEHADQQLGGLDGVIYAVAETSAELLLRPFAEVDREHAEHHFRGKLVGLEVLADLLEERRRAGRGLDFCLLMSSNASVLGGLGLTAYAAANHAVDAVAARRDGEIPWIASNWDGWRADEDEGDAVDLVSGGDTHFMEREAALDAFRRVLGRATLPQIVVSVGDLGARWNRWMRPGDPSREAPRGTGEHHPRPTLATAYAAPRNATEEILVEILGDLLGVDGVGIHDSFFELGGSSLLGTRLLVRVRERFSLDLGLRVLFEGPTAAQLADALLAARAEEVEDTDMDRLLAEVEGLSPDELAALLEMEPEV